MHRPVSQAASQRGDALRKKREARRTYTQPSSGRIRHGIVELSANAGISACATTMQQRLRSIEPMAGLEECGDVVVIHERKAGKAAVLDRDKLWRHAAKIFDP